MRSPVIAFSIFAAAAVSPSLVAAAPANTPAVALPGSGTVPVTNAVSSSHHHDSNHKNHEHNRRALDGNTAGGNAYSGGASDATGGSIVNESEDDPDDTINNNLANAAGTSGTSTSGDAEGGRGRGRGPGGNAYTGTAGRANGGNVINDGGDIANAGMSNAAGEGSTSLSGDAQGGDAKKKRAYDAYTAGGNAYSGGSGDTSSGNIINEADDEATVTNTGPGTNIGDIAGDSQTGDSEGGNGNGKGPGGNAYSGYAGPTRGGNIINEGGSVANTGGTNTGGNGADSGSGDAFGGDA